MLVLALGMRELAPGRLAASTASARSMLAARSFVSGSSCRIVCDVPTRALCISGKTVRGRLALVLRSRTRAPVRDMRARRARSRRCMWVRTGLMQQARRSDQALR